MIEKHFIHDLLERYYAGNTNLEEENLLRDILEDSALDASFIPDREMFRALQNVQPPADFLSSLESTVDNIFSEKHQADKLKSRRLLKFFTRFTAAAACAALIFTIAVPRNETVTYAETDELNGMTPQEIGVNTMMALSMISRTINNGSRTAAQVSSFLSSTISENVTQQ